MFGEGISKMSELIDVGVKLGIVQKSGAWFNYGDVRLGQGRYNAKIGRASCRERVFRAV